MATDTREMPGDETRAQVMNDDLGNNTRDKIFTYNADAAGRLLKTSQQDIDQRRNAAEAHQARAAMDPATAQWYSKLSHSLPH